MPMSLKQVGIIEFPDALESAFDHGAFDAATRRIFVAHTARDRVEVVDHDGGRHLTTLDGFPEAAGVVAADGQVLVTNRRAAELVWIDARTLETRAVFETGARPNGVALVPRAVGERADEKIDLHPGQQKRQARVHSMTGPPEPGPTVAS